MSTSSVCFKILVFYLTAHFTLFLYFPSKINRYGRATTLFNSNNTKTYITLMKKYDGWVYIAKWYSARPQISNFKSPGKM